MEKRNKQRKNRGKFQKSCNDTKLKEESSTDCASEPCTKTFDASPLVAACSDENAKATAAVEVPDSGVGPEPEAEAVPSTKFSNRKVVSNWNRYEEDVGSAEGSETDFRKGGDFRELIDTSGGATSFFRFKDELEWEDQPTQSTAAEFLSLNCKDLASALLCVPLPTRLLIKEELFPKKILKKLEAAAKNQEKQYAAEKSLSPSVSREAVNHTTQLLINACSDKMFTDNLEEEEEEEISEASCKIDTDGATFTWATNEEMYVDNKIEHSASLKDVPIEGESMDTEPVPQSPSKQEVSAAADISTTKSKLSVDDDLEFLLGLSTSQTVVSNTPEAVQCDDTKHELQLESKSSQKPEVKLFESSESTSQNLEDWLDSVLEE